MSELLKGFITYSHEDKDQKDELRKRLSVMEQQNELVTWDDGQLTPGDKALQEDILEKVADSDLLLYLVSAASLDSKNCNRELSEALKQEMRVIPIILEHCDWLRHEVSRFEVLPDKGKPITKWDDETEGWQNVVDGIWEAIDVVQDQTDLSPEDAKNERLAEWIFQQGNFLVMLKQFNKAIEAYSHAIDLNLDDAGFYNNRGAAYMEKGDFDHAIEDFNKAINLNSDDAGFYNNRGIAYDKKGKVDEAIKEYNIAIKLNPDYPGVYYNLGVTYEKVRKFGKAIKNYNIAIKLNPDYTEAYGNRGITYTEKGDFDRAIEDYNTAIRLKPNNAIAYNNRGMAYNEKGDHERAIRDCSKAIHLKTRFCRSALQPWQCLLQKTRL